MYNISNGGSTVEAISWDLTHGVARNVIGKLIIRGTSSSAAPRSIDHVGLVVYNRLYEFGARGVLKRNLPRDETEPQPSYPAFKLRKREIVGLTAKTRQEVVEWLVNIKYNEYKENSYDLVNHNCLDFVDTFCRFLGVQPLENWQRVRMWARNNRRYAEIFQRGLRTRSVDMEDGAGERQSEAVEMYNRGYTRSASIETLPPSYEEAVGLVTPRY